MNDHQRQTAFLKRVILYDDTPERHALEKRITQAQRDEHCIRRAAWLMGLFIALALAGLGYAAVFLPDFPRDTSHWIVNILATIGLASIICLVAFVGYWALHRHELDKRRDECRRLATRLLDVHLGQPGARKVVPASQAQEAVSAPSTDPHDEVSGRF